MRILLFTFTTVISQYTPLHRKLIHRIQYLFICRLLFFKKYVCLVGIFNLPLKYNVQMNGKTEV